jgi:rifampicin phosphotransferase
MALESLTQPSSPGAPSAASARTAPAAIILEPATTGDDAAARLGGKARSLLALGRVEGVRVPDWFAISADLFAAALDEAGVADDIAAALAALRDGDGEIRTRVDACAARLAPLLDRLAVPATATRAIDQAYERLGGGFVSVRSSALDEDGAERSFAGCLDTSLFVRGVDEVRAAVLRCWRSAFSPRSLAYRATHGALDATIGVAVVVQRMVDGAVSGVLFTADPTSGDRAQTLLTATWGLGEGVVSGRLACDTFVVSGAGAKGATIERDVVDKSHAIVAAAGGGTHEVEVDPARREVSCLDDAQLGRLTALGRAIEAAYGMPVDCEWTWSDDGPYFLQARPITTIAPAAAASAAAGGKRRLWDNSNIIESYDGVTTPLTYSFARRAYATVYRQAFEVLGTPAAELDRNTMYFDQMIGLLGGRIYYNLESWYAVLRLLPGYRFNAEFMEQMMGVAESADFSAERPQLSAARRYVVELPRLLAALTQLGARLVRVDTLIDDFYRNFGEAYADFEALDLGQLGLDELVSTYLEAERRLLQRWQAPIVNDILAMVFFGAMRKALTAWGLGDGGLYNDLLCGEGGLESTEPTRNLLTIMADVRRDPALCELLAAEEPAVVAARVASDPRFGWLAVRIESHVARYGDRCVDELKLEEPTLRDDPTFLYAALKGYLSAPPVTVEEMETRERRIRAEAEARARAHLGRNPARRRSFDWLLGRARLHVKNRENLRFARTRAFGLVRRLVLAMGARLAEAGRLDRADDVFYLEIAELIAFSRGTGTTTDLRGLVEVRRREFAGHRAAAPLADRFWTEGPVYLDPKTAGQPASGEQAEQAATGAVLQGVGASPGVTRAPARLVTDPHATQISGDVLVANRTDPGWVPLFPSAAAVVVERGSVLSHSAIVAREFGIPCVVGIRDALSRLRDGQLIEVDGHRGTVTVL